MIAELVEVARRESRARRMAWIATAAFMVSFPAVVALGRAPGFTASAELAPIRVNGFPPRADPGYYRPFLAQPHLRQEMDDNVPDPIPEDVWGTVRIRRAPPARLLVSAKLDTPERARDFVAALGPQLGSASARDVVARATAELTPALATFRRTRGAAARRRLAPRVKRLARLISEHPPRVVVVRAAETPELTHRADRFVDSLPGDLPGRPSPIWAALAGLLVAVTLWTIGLVLWPPRASDPAR